MRVTGLKRGYCLSLPSEGLTSCIFLFCRRKANEDKENIRRSDDDDEDEKEYHGRLQQSDSDNDTRSQRRKERKKYDSERYKERERHDNRRRRSDDDDGDNGGWRADRRKRQERRSDRRRQDTPSDDERYDNCNPVEKKGKYDERREQLEQEGSTEKTEEPEKVVRKKANTDNPLLTRTGKLYFNVQYI